MVKRREKIGNAEITFLFGGKFEDVQRLAGNREIIVITDENVFAANKRKLSHLNSIVVPAGEAYKNQSTVDEIIECLIQYRADRNVLLIGLGGGVITDITGYVAAIYLRGVSVGLVPTSILAMVDAAIGGKNGIDKGLYKNIIGTIRQPEFILYDYGFLKSLPHDEWVNGFAEIIKHAAIKDRSLFQLLSKSTLSQFKKDPALLHRLIMRNASIKINIVVEDVFEKGDRKLLNFGHTIGHAIENMLLLPHGHAISVGMVLASAISNKLTGFTDTLALIQLLEKYELPTHADFNLDLAVENLVMDKKRIGSEIQFILLDKIGKAIVKPIEINEIRSLLLGD